MEFWSSGGVLRVYGRVGGREVWSSGDAPQACRCGSVRLKNSGALEVRCRRRDIEVWGSGALEACCTCRDVEGEAQRSELRRCAAIV